MPILLKALYPPSKVLKRRKEGKKKREREREEKKKVSK
jgi:hypothetical protein